MAEVEGDIPIDDALRVIASPLRRGLLRFLMEETNQSIHREELVERFGDEHPVDPGSLRVALAHNHLPRLADAEVIEYDPPSGRLRLTEVASELEPLLDVIDEWGRA